MLEDIKYPKKCSDQELEDVLALDASFFIDFPFSPVDQRTLTMADYQEEQHRRKLKANKILPDSKDEFLVQFMNQISLQIPSLRMTLKDATLNCTKKREPTRLVLNIDGPVCKAYIAHIAVRTAVKRLTGCTLIATSVSDFWLLPSSMDGKSWVEKKGKIASAQEIGHRYPYVSVVLELLAKEAQQKQERCAITEIENPVKLQEVIDVLAVFPHYIALEELHRVVFALGYGNKVIARSIAAYSKEYNKFISPEAQLETWQKYS
jgi:hypothetical protein